jgi:hypothetical protein
MFDTHGGGLTCVVYNATGDDVAKLRDGLIALYGRPGKDSEFGPLRTLSWQTPDKIELAINQAPLAAVVSHCAPGDGDGRAPAVRYPAGPVLAISLGPRIDNVLKRPAARMAWVDVWAHTIQASRCKRQTPFRLDRVFPKSRGCYLRAVLDCGSANRRADSG